MEIREPTSPSEWASYYALRYRVLREPWNQPLGSERDEKEFDQSHFAAFDNNVIVGVGRLDYIDPSIRQIRFMAVEPSCQCKGVGSNLMILMESEAWNSGATEIILHARENVLGFYEKLGYICVKPSHLLFGEIQHFLMKKKKG